LETKVNNLSDFLREIEVTLSYDEIKPIIDEAYKDERKKIVIPGFRKGKAPMNMIKKLYGDAIEYHATEKIAESKFWEAIEEEKNTPINVPKLTDIDYKGEEGMTFKAEYEVMPEITVKDYTGLEVEKLLFDVNEEDVEKEVQKLLKSKAEFVEADVVEDSNYRIVADLQRVDDNGEPFKGSEPAKDMTIDLTEENVNPQIVENVVGKKVGDTFNFDFEDEHKHGEETHKVTYHYVGTIKKVEKIQLPEPTDDFIKEATKGKNESLEDFKNELRTSFKNYFDQQSEEMMLNSLLSKISDNNKFDVPTGYVEVVLKRLVDYEKEQAKRYNQPEPDENILRKDLQGRAEWNAKWQIMLEAIAKQEKIEVTDDDLKVLAEKEAEQTGIPVDKLIKYYKDSNRDTALLEDKVIEFLKSNNTITEKNVKDKAEESKKKREEAVAEKENSDNE
jgi:trigger factor